MVVNAYSTKIFEDMGYAKENIKLFKIHNRFWLKFSFRNEIWLVKKVF